MTSTIDSAIQHGDANWQITCKIISHQIFIKRSAGELKHLLIILLADENGDMIEIKSWGRDKAFTVYHKFKPGDTLLVKGSGPFREPNRAFSMSRCDVYSRWWIDPFDSFHCHKFIHCISDIDCYRRTKRKPANVVGIFHSFVEGNHTYRKDSAGRVVTQGYYVRFTDSDGKLCQALVWHSLKVERAKFALFHAKPGSSVLFLPFAREQEERYKNRTPGIYMITTTYPPVLDPPCIDPAMVKKLRQSRQSLQMGEEVPYNPTAQMNGTH